MLFSSIIELTYSGFLSNAPQYCTLLPIIRYYMRVTIEKNMSPS